MTIRRAKRIVKRQTTGRIADHSAGLSEEMGKQAPAEGFIEQPGRDILLDDPDRIVQYRAVALAEGLEEGTEAEVLWAWQWLGDHPEVTNRLQGWFGRRVLELRAMGRIK